MPNPNRPQYQDTIEETWGQAVADTVVRRYTSSADRDADLAEFTPAELMGQVVVLAPGGAIPYLQSHDGVRWGPVSPMQDQSGFGVIVKWGARTAYNTDGAGHARVPFATAFPSALDGVITGNGQLTNSAFMIVHVAMQSSDAGSFDAFPVDAAGNGIASNVIIFPWIAFGH
jgi:hypothetical protein